MKIPLLDLKAQYAQIKDEVGEAIEHVLRSQSFILGEEVEALESEIASYCRAKYGVGVASGTDALFLSLKALGIKEGDEVITTPFTFVATAEAVSYLGARPVFVDIDRDTYNIDPALIEPKITKKTKAILPVHLYGQCADMDPISALAEKYNLKIVEDCAQSIGASYKERRAGSMGDAGCLSFFPSKNLGGFGDGGMVVTDDKDLADRLRVLRVHGSSRRYYHDEVGYNSRLDNLQAAVLRVKLRRLDGWLDARRALAAKYRLLLSGSGVRAPFVSEYNVHTYHLYVIAAKDRDGLAEYMNKSGIKARAYYPVPLHLQRSYAALGYKKGGLPISEKASENTLAIPLYPELKEDEQKRVADCIREFYGRDKDTAVSLGGRDRSEGRPWHKGG